MANLIKHVCGIDIMIKQKGIHCIVKVTLLLKMNVFEID